MKRIIELLLLLFFTINSYSQNLIGDWIKTKATYINDIELSNDNVLKNQYIRYSFEKDNKLFISVKYDDKGTGFFFNISSNILEIKNSYGFLINSFLLDKISDREIVLIQKGQNGFNGNDCIKYSFVKEYIYQNNLPLKDSDLLVINEEDTIYKTSEKIHAKFLGDKSFFDFCSDNIPEVSAVMATNNLFIATFIISKTGQIDSVQILENINKRFEKQFRKALDKSKGLWKPAELHGESVSVQTEIKFKFVTSNKFIPMYDFMKKGKIALDNEEYLKALNYFELALERIPDNHEIIYYKAICEMNLGNNNAACEDFEMVKSSGLMDVSDLIRENCKK